MLYVVIAQVRELADPCSAQDLAPLLFVALRVSCKSLRLLISAPAAKKLKQGVILEVLMDAVRNSRDAVRVVRMLIEHPAVQPMHPRWMGELMKGAVEGGNNDVFCELCALPAAQETEIVALEELVKAAVKNEARDYRIASKLFQLPRAQQIGVAALEELLVGALKSGNFAIATHLCHLPAAQQIGVAALEELLLVAADAGDYQTLSKLFQLPAAQQLAAASLEQLLRVAVKDGRIRMLRTTFQLPAATHIRATALAELLTGAIKDGNCRTATYLCRVPAVRQFDVAALEELLKVAVEAGEYRILSKPAARQWHRSGRSGIAASVAVKGGNGRIFSIIFQVPAATHVGVAALKELLTGARKVANWGFVRDFCRLPSRCK
jgi:hypothetical protein